MWKPSCDQRYQCLDVLLKDLSKASFEWVFPFVGSFVGLWPKALKSLVFV